MIVQNITTMVLQPIFTVPLDDEKKAVNDLKNSHKIYKIHSNNICRISIVSVGMKSNVGVAEKMFETLAKRI